MLVVQPFVRRIQALLTIPSVNDVKAVALRQAPIKNVETSEIGEVFRVEFVETVLPRSIDNGCPFISARTSGGHHLEENPQGEGAVGDRPVPLFAFKPDLAIRYGSHLVRAARLFDRETWDYL